MNEFRIRYQMIHVSVSLIVLCLGIIGILYAIIYQDYLTITQGLSETQSELAETSKRSTELQDEHGQTKQALAELEGQLVDTRSALAEEQERYRTVSNELADTKSALAGEQKRYRDTSGILGGVRQALEQASATVQKIRFARARENEENAAAQEAIQAKLLEARQREWQAGEDAVSLHLELLGTKEIFARTKRDLMEAQETQQPSAATEALADLVRQHFADEIQQNHLSVRVDSRSVKLVSADMFDYVRGVELGTRSVKTLDRLTKLLQETPSYHVRFAVHTDTIPLRQGSRWPTNWEYSTARAAKLARYLIDKGVLLERLSIGGYAGSRPVADNSTLEGRRQNRRVEVTITPSRQW